MLKIPALEQQHLHLSPDNEGEVGNADNEAVVVDKAVVDSFEVVDSFVTVVDYFLHDQMIGCCYPNHLIS